MTSSPFISIFTPLQVYVSIGNNSSQLLPLFLCISNEEGELLAGCQRQELSVCCTLAIHYKVENLYT